MDFFNFEHAGFVWSAWAVGVGVLAAITALSYYRLRQAQRSLAQYNSDKDNG